MPVSRKRPSVAVRTKKTRTAEHRPATRKRRYQHDDLVVAHFLGLRLRAVLHSPQGMAVPRPRLLGTPAYADLAPAKTPEL